MTSTRERIKDNFPTVLLTLLSIVQALALELLWNHLDSAPYLFSPSPLALLCWLQIAATLMGIILIWLVYASNAMRFRWVPATGDSTLPFVIGIIEFILVAELGPDSFGIWLALMGVVFALMTWTVRSTMHRARQDADNAEFFAQVPPAKLVDFIPHIALISALLLAGVFVHLSDNNQTVAAVAVVGTLGLLAWQYRVTARFWQLSINQAEQSVSE
ncbi:MAG: hypothetical protein HKO71_07160 [Pseudomonadales bacterium]|nr:hypothetical protein [Pseudomonadales bacterium]